MTAVLPGLVATSLLMLLVMAIRRPVAHFCGAQWAYALWLLPVLLPLLRLVLPPLTMFEPSVSPIVVILPVVDTASAPLAAEGQALDWASLLFAIWVGGAAMFLSWQQSAYGAFLLHLGPSGKPANPPFYGGVRVIESDAVDGPVAVGIFKRRIVVPVDFASRYSELEQRLALEHELIHHRRFDIGWNMVALVVLALNWFNPIAHAAFRAFRADQELACDASIACRAPNSRKAYACAIVKSASQAGLIAAAPLNHAAFLKRRLKMMNSHRGGWARALGGFAALLVSGAGGLVLSSPGQARNEAEDARPVILASAGGSAAVIEPAELATLKRECECEQPDGSNIIVCKDGAALRHPEVRAIVDKVQARIPTRIAAALPPVERMRDVEASTAKAGGEAAAIDDSLAGAAAVLRAAEHAMAATDAHGIDVLYHPHDGARAHMSSLDDHPASRHVRAVTSSAHQQQAKLHRLSAEERADLRRDLAEMRRELAAERREMQAEMAAERREARRELYRELKELRVKRGPTH